MIPVPGTAIRWVWHRLKRADWQTVIREAGVMLRQLHSIRAPRRLRGLNTAIMARHTIPACKRLRIFSPKLLAELRDRLPALAVYARRRPHMLLHGDMNETHVAVVRRGGRWHVTGFFDFGNAVAGNPINEWTPYWRSTRNDLEYFRTFVRTWRQKFNITPVWRERAAALLLFHSDGPEAVVQACHRLKVNPSRLTWNGLRDLLLPPILDTQRSAVKRL